MNKESSNTLIKRGRMTDKIAMVVGGILIIGLIIGAVVGITKATGNKSDTPTTEVVETVVE